MRKRKIEMKEELKEKKLNQMMMKIQQVYHKRKKNQIITIDYLVEPELNKQQEWLLVKKHPMVSILIHQPINYHNLLNSHQEPIPTLN